MQNECRLSIISVNYNGLKDTCALIESIPFNENMEVIVVDNASIQDEASIIQKQFPQVKVIRSEKNLGFAGGNNLGIKKAKGKYLFLINNDTIFKEFNVDSLINRYSLPQDSLYLGNKTYSIHWLYSTFKNNSSQSSNWLL